MPDTEYCVVLVTAGRQAPALEMARALVDEGLAACVQVVPGGTAIYRWEGATHEEPMSQLIIKTRMSAWPALRERIVALHSDEVPEILALPVRDGLPAYLHWMDEVVG